jgi:uncharacterized protein (DUF2384 family)
VQTKVDAGTYASSLIAVGRTELDPQAVQAFVGEAGDPTVLAEINEEAKSIALVYVSMQQPVGVFGSTPTWQTTPETIRFCGRRANFTTKSTYDLASNRWEFGLNCAPLWMSRTNDGGSALKDRENSVWTDATMKLVRWLFTAPSETVDQPAVESPVKEPHQEALDWIEEATGLPWEYIRKLLRVSRPTLTAWKNGEPISNENRRRLFAIRDVLERAARRHPRQSNLVAWLETPRGADGRTPADLLEAGEIDRARLLAMTNRSPGLKTTPKSVQRQMSEAYWSSRERVEAYPPDLDEELLDPLEDED